MKIDKELVKDMSLFLGLPEKEIIRRYEGIRDYPGFVKWCNITELEWKEKNINQSDTDSLRGFYANTQNYIWELVEYHSTNFKKELSKKVIDITKQNGGETILDFGAGIGQDSIIQQKAGFEATAADIPSKTFEFAKWRFMTKGLNIGVKDLVSEDTALNQNAYDTIICFEVLQQVMNPQGVLQRLYNGLRKGGLLLTTYRFEDNYALALDDNKKYGKNFDSIVKGQGFELRESINILRPEDGRIKTLEAYQK